MANKTEEKGEVPVSTNCLSISWIWSRSAFWKCAPPSEAQAKLQPWENCQAAHTIKDDLEPRSIILYGVPQSFDASPASRIKHDIAQLQMIFGRLLPSDQTVTIEVLLSCQDDIVGRYLTVFLTAVISRQCAKSTILRCSRSDCFNKNLHSTAKEEFFHPSITQPTHFRTGDRLSMLDLVLSEFPYTTSAIKLLARVGIMITHNYSSNLVFIIHTSPQCYVQCVTMNEWKASPEKAPHCVTGMRILVK